MEAMSLLRRRLVFPYLFYTLFCAFLTGLAGWSAEQYLNLEFVWLLVFCSLLFAVLQLCVFVILIERPLSRVIHEMKALLTGRAYRRIMTD